MKEVAKDVNGDIIGLGEQKYIIITPAGSRFPVTNLAVCNQTRNPVFMTAITGWL